MAKNPVTDCRPCGCHINEKKIQFCQYHAQAPHMMKLLSLLRGYFLETTGEESPFVKKIDEMVPRGF